SPAGPTLPAPTPPDGQKRPMPPIQSIWWQILTCCIPPRSPARRLPAEPASGQPLIAPHLLPALPTGRPLEQHHYTVGSPGAEHLGCRAVLPSGQHQRPGGRLTRMGQIDLRQREEQLIRLLTHLSG